MSRNALYEFIQPNKENLLVEARGQDIVMSGIFIQSEVQNQNGRVYPFQEIKHAVETVNQRIRSGESVVGELDHPEVLSINLDRVSHQITDMHMEGNNGIGKLKIIDKTPMGKIAKGLIESGIKLGVSSRGSGNVGHDGKVSDFEIVTVDIVLTPSAPDAFPRVIYESLYNMRGGYIIEEIARDSIHNQKSEKHLQQALKRFISELKQ